MKRKNKQRKRLTIEDRMVIQTCIHQGMNITEIASRIGVNKSTISREINKYSYIKNGNDLSCSKRKAGGTCNKCKTVGYCKRRKRYYDFALAEEKSKNLRSTSRSHTSLNEEILKQIDEIVKDGVRRGQSLHHIYVSNPELKSFCCERTIRRLCYRGLLSIKPYELRRYVTYKHSYKKTKEEMRLSDIRVLIGRTYKDFKKTTANHKKYNVVQYDSLIGKKDDKQAILTITFPKYAFQFGLLIKKSSPGDVICKIKVLFKHLGTELTKKIFPINLADNGVEFSYFNQIEIDNNGEKICSTYFTNPYKATDKAECERLHELVRYFLPKGKSLDSLNQKQVNEIFSNINSYIRKSKNDKTPYDMVSKKFGKAFLDTIGIRRIPNKLVVLKQILD